MGIPEFVFREERYARLEASARIHRGIEINNRAPPYGNHDFFRDVFDWRYPWAKEKSEPAQESSPETRPPVPKITLESFLQFLKEHPELVKKNPAGDSQ